ncbi:MAG: YqhA family protein, partial [Muribaculaceae bacterium]|nr:YqhA family protein [Muribaculaceae bacterium]
GSEMCIRVWFITKIDPVLQKVDGRPSWMQVKNVDDLKSSLGKVILMVLIVTFFKYSIEVEYGNVNDLLKLGVGIVLISAALYITGKSHH